ncbi:mechanosensitive ion channel family protein [Aliiglaciecola sp. LCG003]|uniref:mechanosensitive ion channel family protein n=1 Tax=Aliiglaciecola sp. LCG003 TaxID=3053655 RepID=UPI00257263E8|nr:mechanosensitive ion channel family protein [Aliiglaciecola sp. LCG003]WJG09644.1 mechanosensitive ion channel family protein [Aliiglaciecola sp. LCG003]
MKLEALDNFWGLINEKLQVWLEASIKHLPNFIVAIAIAIFFAIAARYSSKMLRNVLGKTMESKQIADLLASIFKIIILVIGLFIALDFLGLSGTVKSLLAGAGIVGLAIGFAFQDMTENLIAGIAMGVRKPFMIGDVIKAEGVFGTVKTINLRNTLVETFFGQEEVIPNKILFRNILTNYSVNRIRRLEIPFGISYADDPQKAADVVVEKINECDFVIKKDETAVFAESFGDSSVNLLLWFWIDYPGGTGFMQARHEAVTLVKKALEEADILIPFPIRTLDFGAKGGEKLNTMLSQKKAESASDKTESKQKPQADSVDNADDQDDGEA